MPHRLLERHAPHTLDNRLVRQADSELQSTATDYLANGERLLGQHHWMSRIGGDHRCAQLDFRNLATSHGQCREGIDAEDLRYPEAGESLASSDGYLFDDLVDLGFKSENSDLHGALCCVLRRDGVARLSRRT